MFLDRCPEGDGYVIILEKCYYIEKESLNNADATLNCQNHSGFTYNGRLFEPRDSTTYYQVIEAAKKISEGSKFWIGINDLRTEGTFRYATGGDLVFKNWRIKEPNNTGKVILKKLLRWALFMKQNFEIWAYVHTAGSDTIFIQIYMDALPGVPARYLSALGF